MKVAGEPGNELDQSIVDDGVGTAVPSGQGAPLGGRQEELKEKAQLYSMILGSQYLRLDLGNT